jgi:hypothetical protein
MAVIDHPAVDEGVSSRLIAKGPRWLWLGAGVAAVVVLFAAVFGFLLWADHYQPIVFGGAATGAIPNSATLEAVRPTDSMAASRVIIHPQPGHTYAFAEAVGARGPFAVQVVGVRVEPPSDRPVLESRFKVSAKDGSFSATDMVDNFVSTPSFTLDGRGRGLQLLVTVPTCHPADPSRVQSPTIDTIWVKYKFLWFTHYAAVDIANSYSQDGPVVFKNMPNCDRG